MNGLDGLIKITCIVFVALMLVSCSVEEDSQEEKTRSEIISAVRIHEEKIRNHFLGSSNTVDISTLIAETTSISSSLKKAGMYKEARKFDSYIDVLTFGNNTIDESISDVMKLIRSPSLSSLLRKQQCPTLSESIASIFQCNT
ncbi:hypothetical protein FACS189449_08690 [Alphaproteobacteria bacterium]|nr:hypothetical protein FACS189449_08690 [Alphaproteobacteria bacterium]